MFLTRGGGAVARVLLVLHGQGEPVGLALDSERPLPELAAVAPANLVGSGLLRSIESDLALVGDHAWGGAVRDAVGLAVPDPLEWANRVIELPAGGWALAGIRFRGRDVTKTFVDVIACSVRPDAAGLEALGSVLGQFRAFSPLCFRVRLPGDARRGSGLSGHGTSVALDQLVVAGPVSVIADGEETRGAASVELVPTTPEAAAPRVAAIYETLRRATPDLDEWVTPADADGLGDADEQGLLFDVVVDGRAAGVVAAARDDAYGFSGFVVEEIALDEDHRGRGFGPAVLRASARRLPATDADILWGHIHPDHTPSLRNALASGRTVCATLAWVTPDGWPGMPGARPVA